MDNRNQQIQQIIQHIDRIETELALLRQLVNNLISDNDEVDQDLILIDAELVVPEIAVVPPVHEPQQDPRAVIPGAQRALTRRQIRQDARWRAQNWAIRDRRERTEREALEQLGRAARQNRN